jgi:hypothetical protein
MFGFPLLLIPLAIFNIVVFLMPGVDFSAPAFAVALMSGATWTVAFGDILVIAALALLLCEIVKVGRAGGRYLTDHLLSLVVLAAATAEFVWLTPFASFPFFLLCAFAFVDFAAGIALHRRRARAPAPAAAAPPAAAPQAEPAVAPAPVPPAPPPVPAPQPATPPPPPPGDAPVERPPGAEPSLGALVPGVAAVPLEETPPPSSEPQRPAEKS